MITRRAFLEKAAVFLACLPFVKLPVADDALGWTSAVKVWSVAADKVRLYDNGKASQVSTLSDAFESNEGTAMCWAKVKRDDMILAHVTYWDVPLTQELIDEMSNLD